MNGTHHFYQRVVEPLEERMIHSIWRITRKAEDAEDAMQNALVAIWKHRHRMNVHANPDALILRICLDAACDIVRTRMRERDKRATVAANRYSESAQLPCEEVTRQELTDEVIAAIAKLPRQQATAITLRSLENLSFEHVAAAMDCKPATARKHVERARERLRLVLAKHEPSVIPQARS